MCDDGIEQLLTQANEFLIEELNDDTYEKLMLEEKELRDDAVKSSRLRIEQGREEGHRRLVADYFADEEGFKFGFTFFMYYDVDTKDDDDDSNDNNAMMLIHDDAND
nr:hypothetical protein [Tanacetum cinerariifolium]